MSGVKKIPASLPECSGVWTGAAILGSMLLILLTAWRQEPRGFLHPDSLIFTHFCLAALDSAPSWHEWPAAVGEAFRNCSQYDWNRGRITGYALFLLGGVTRPFLGTGFLDPVALLLMGANAWLASALFRKFSVHGQGAAGTLMAVILLLSPFSFVAVQTQFIYAKYLCTAFMLGAILAASPAGKVFCLLGGIFSDEIGLLFAMIYGGMFLAERLGLFRPCPWPRKAAALAVAGGWAGLTWMFYHGSLQLFFGKLPVLMKKSKALPGWEQVGESFFYPLKTVLYGWSCLFLTPSNQGDGPSLISGFPWNPWWGLIFLPGLVACLWAAGRYRSDCSRKKPFPVEAWRDLLCLAATLITVNFVFYKGQMGDYGYYGYPIFVGLTLGLFLFLDFLNRPAAAGLAALLVLSSLLGIPATQRVIRERIAKEHLDGTIPLSRVAELERLILQVGHHRPLPDSLATGQDLAITTFNRFKEEYFPVKGIARIFLWPRVLPGSLPNLTPTP